MTLASTARIWDHNGKLIGTLPEGSARGEGDNRVVILPADNHVAEWLVSQHSTGTPYLTVDGEDGRWSGVLRRFTSSKFGGVRTVESEWFSDEWLTRHYGVTAGPDGCQPVDLPPDLKGRYIAPAQSNWAAVEGALRRIERLLQRLVDHAAPRVCGGTLPHSDDPPASLANPGCTVGYQDYPTMGDLAAAAKRVAEAQGDSYGS